MNSRFFLRAALAVAALTIPAAAHAQLGKLGKKLGKAIGQEVVGQPVASASNSAPVLTPQMLDAFLKGIAVEAEPRMAAKQQYEADLAAFDRWEFQLDSLGKLLVAEYNRANSGATQCAGAASSDPDLMQLNMQMARKVESMSAAEREAIEARMEVWGDRMRAAYQANDMATVRTYTDSIRSVLGVDLTAASLSQNSAYQQCLAKQQAATGIDTDRIQALNDQIGRLQQNPPGRPSDSDLDVPQVQRDSLRALGLAASGLGDAEYAWAREQSWAYLAMLHRGEMTSADPDWLEMMQAREAKLRKYEFVIAEG